MNSSTSISDRAAADERQQGWRYVRRLLAVWLLCLTLPAAIVIVVDPYQVFHRSWLPQTLFYKQNERYQIPGLIRHYLGDEQGYDSIVAGTSMSSNFSSPAMQRVLSWRALNLSIRASTLAERHYVLEKALATGQVRRVLLEVFADDVADNPDPVDTEDAGFPFYLYTDSLGDKSRYVFNLSVLHAAWALLSAQGYLAALPPVLQSSLSPQDWVTGKASLDNWSVWLDEAERQDRFGRYNTVENRQALQQALAAARHSQASQRRAVRSEPAFDTQRRYIIDLVRAHPGVEFRIWFAAASLLKYAGHPDPDYIEANVALRRLLIRELAGEPNVMLYGFDNELAITGDLRHYLDPVHFSRAVQENILQSIAGGHHRLLPADADRYADQFRQQVMAFGIQVPEQQGYLQKTK